MNPKCPECGKFLKNVAAIVNGFDEVVQVEGDCKTHGVVKNFSDWDYSDFYPEPESES